MISDKSVYQMIKDNPDKSRKLLYDRFVGASSGRNRRDRTIKLLGVLNRLIKNGRIIETEIVRGKRGNKIVQSRLNVNSDRQNIGLIRSGEPKSHMQFDKMQIFILTYLSLHDKPASLTEISRHVNIAPMKLYLLLRKLERNGIITRINDITTRTNGAMLRPRSVWKIADKASIGLKEKSVLQSLYQTTPADNFFYHIPMLIENPGESISHVDLAQRAHGYQGFYEKFKMDDRAARDDFLKKIQQHLENETLKRSFIHEDFLKYKITDDEDQLFLWRLYAWLHTVLFKSSKNRKLGISVLLYDKLIELVGNTWKEIENMSKSLSKEDRFVVLLLLNGVQLETILPKDRVVQFRQKLQQCGFPVTVYNAGTLEETTLIEMISHDKISLKKHADGLGMYLDEGK